MSKKHILTTGMLILVILIATYYICMLFDTRRIMKEFNKAICDENYSSEEPDAEYYERKRPEEGRRTIPPVRRYFTWCWNGKGKIWLYYKREYTYPDKVIINPSYPVVDIEKKNGKWIITGWHDPA